MTEEREDGKVYFKVNNVPKAEELRKLFRFALEEDMLYHYQKNAGQLLEEIIDDEKAILFTKEQLDFLTGLLLFLLSEKRHIAAEMGIDDPEELDREVGGFFLADTMALLTILRDRLPE